MGRKGAWAEGSMGQKGVWGAKHIPTHHPPLAPSSYDISQPAGRHLPYYVYYERLDSGTHPSTLEFKAWSEVDLERGAAVAGGSEVAGARLRRAAFGPKIPPSGEAKLPPISGPKSSLRTVKLEGGRLGRPLALSSSPVHSPPAAGEGGGGGGGG